MKRWWSLFVEAVRGSERDYTVGPVGPALVMLSVPMVLEMAMESLFAVVDVFYVSRVSAEAVATVGVTESMLTIVYTVALGLGIGAMAVVARRIGEKDDEGAAQAAAQAIALGLIVALAVGLVGYFNAESLLRAMGASPLMIETSIGYTKVMFAGNATVTLLFLINAIFRGAGDPAIAMRMLWLGNAINIVVCPFLIFGIGPFPELGVTGAAIGTNIGRGTAVVTQLWMLGSGRSRIHIRARHLQLVPAVMWNVCRLSGSGFLQILIDTSSYIGLVRVISTFGSDALAGYTIGIRTVIFAILPAWGLSNAAATMVGQALGAGKPDRAEQAVWTAGKYNAIVLGVVGVLFVVFAPQIVAIYTADAGGGAVRDRLPAHRQHRLRVLRLRVGLHAIVQRRRRHLDADVDQPGVFLGLADPAGVAARDPVRHGPARRVHRDDGGVLDAGGRERDYLSPRLVEDAACLAPRHRRHREDPFSFLLLSAFLGCHGTSLSFRYRNVPEDKSIFREVF